MEEIEFAICPQASNAELRDFYIFLGRLQHLNAPNHMALPTLFCIDSIP